MKTLYTLTDSKDNEVFETLNWDSFREHAYYLLVKSCKEDIMDSVGDVNEKSFTSNLQDKVARLDNLLELAYTHMDIGTYREWLKEFGYNIWTVK